MAKRKWTKETVVAGIRQLHASGVPASHIWRTNRSLCMAGFSVFGSWRAALQAAGLQSERQVWSADRVLAELRALDRRGSPSCASSSRLVSAASRYFGGLQKALVAAGLREDRPPKDRNHRTPTDVIEGLRSRRAEGLSLTAVWKDDLGLYSAAKRMFGSWGKAMDAAGLSAPRPPTPTPDEVIRLIHARCCREQPLRGVWRDDLALYIAAKKRFGSWHKALVAAGLPSRLRQRWTKRTVVEAIRRRHHEGPSLSTVWRDDRKLFRAATNHFGNWRSALQAADVPHRPRRRWSPEKVLDGLRHTYRGQGDFEEADPGLAGAARRLFGGLYQALEAAGLEPPVGRWTKKRIIEAIQERYVRGSAIRFVGFKERALGHAARRHFGTWQAALEAAGLQFRAPSHVPVRTWTRENVIATIQAGTQRDGKLVALWKEDQGLYSAAKKHFGTWRQAVLAAGLQPTRKKWTPSLVIRSIQARHKGGMALSSIVFKEDASLAGAATRLFGSWRTALDAAGVPAPSPRPRPRKQTERTTACRAKT